MMFQAAERALATICGNELNAVFIGNAPCGFYKYRFPKLKPASDDFVGAKVCYYCLICRVLIRTVGMLSLNIAATVTLRSMTFNFQLSTVAIIL